MPADRPEGIREQAGPKTSLREQQRAVTRDRIISALTELIRTNHPMDVTMAAVAAEAGVSEPTLYRHFPNKRVLFGALGSELYRQSTRGVAPAGLDDLAAFLPKLYQFMEANEAVVRWNLSAPKDQAVRPSTEERIPILRQALNEELKGLADEDATFLLRGVLLLTSSIGWLYWQDNLDLDAEEAAKTSAWLLRRIARPER